MYVVQRQIVKVVHVDNYLNCNALDIPDRSGIGYSRSWLLKLQLYLDIHIYMSYLRTTVAILLIPVQYLSNLYCSHYQCKGLLIFRTCIWRVAIEHLFQ